MNINRGDVFDARLDPTEGSEQTRVRPVLVVSRNAINQYSSVIVVAPLTTATNVKRAYPNNVPIAKGEAGLTADSVLLGGQIRAQRRPLGHCRRRRTDAGRGLAPA